jgi:hypothetical protein
MHSRALALLTTPGFTPAGTDVTIERPDLNALESAELRERIDRELAALHDLKRPGAVGAVVFDQPRVETAMAGAAVR